MDSKIKRKCLESEKVSKNKDLSLQWEDQRRMWEIQRQSLFGILFDEKVIDTSSNIGSKENSDDKIMEPKCSKHERLFKKSISFINKKEIELSLKSNVEEKLSFQNYTKKEYNKHTDNDKPKPNIIINVSINDTVKQGTIFTTQKADIKFSPILPMHTYSSFGIDMLPPETYSNNYLINTNETLKTVSTQDFSVLPQPPYATITCYVCDQQVTKGELALHLFFGPLKCNDCHIKVIDCKSFRSDLFIGKNCIHNQLSWSEDPIEYLISTLNKTPMGDNTSIHHYIKCLKSLEQLSPWKFAFQEYRIFKKLNCSDTKSELDDFDKVKCEGEIDYIIDSNCNEVLLSESYDLNQMEHDVQVVGLVDHERIQENFTEIISESKLILNNHAVKCEKNKTQSMFYFDKTIKKGSEKKGHEKKTSYKNKIPTEEFDNINQISKRGKYLKNECFERRKEKTDFVFNNTNNSIESICPNVMDDEIKVSLSNDYQIEFLDLPKDGNYLVSHTPIEECPMCYTVLSLYKCEVNITLLLFTFWCQCGLKIFYMPKTPDNIDHPVKIIEF